MMLRVIAAALLALCATSPAHAWLAAGPAGYGHWLQGVIAPLDGGGAFATPAGAYSFRKLKSAYAGPAVRLHRVSDSAELDINFLGFTGFTGAPIDTAAANAHCAATTCTVVTWYDQSGNARDMVMATAAFQPAYVANCLGTLPCARSANTGNIRVATAGNFTPSTVMTLSGVAKRTGAGVCYVIADGNLNAIQTDLANTWRLAASANIDSAAAAEGAWHSAVGVVNGASSVLRIDATETTGTLTGSAVANPIQGAIGASATTCDFVEDVIWDGYALPVTERSALTANQRNFWGF
jgi:hypothetical protein